MKTTEIIVKSMNVSDISYVDSTTGELVSRVRVEFDAAVPQKRKQLDGSYKDVEDTHIEMKSSALRAKLYSVLILILMEDTLRELAEILPRESADMS